MSRFSMRILLAAVAALIVLAAVCFASAPRNSRRTSGNCSPATTTP
jgi:hypothetical protein